jgi:selenocysteine-specific translation elongation factor
MKEFAKEIPQFEDMTYVVFSAVTGEGVEELRGYIEETASAEAAQEEE